MWDVLSMRQVGVICLWDNSVGCSVYEAGRGHLSLEQQCGVFSVYEKLKGHVGVICLYDSSVGFSLLI